MVHSVRDNRWPTHTALCTLCVISGHKCALMLCLSNGVGTCAGSVVLTQTHPAAPYVCRTGNITLRCQYDGVEGVLGVLWLIGNEAGKPNPSNPGHTALPPTSTYQEVVVDNYTNLRERYQCGARLTNRTILDSNEYEPQNERKYYISSIIIH